MSAGLRDNFTVSIKVDGASLPAAMPNAIGSVQIIANSVFLVPTMRLVLIDPKNVMENELKLTSDNLIEVAMARDSDDGPTFKKFRFFKQKNTVVTEGYAHNILSIYDSPLYTKGIAMSSVKGSTSQVLRTMLGECGFTIGEWQDTQDNQVWINPGLTRGKFANMLVQHSFRSESGLMRLAITSKGEARYIDVLEALTKTPKAVIGYGDKDVLKADYSATDLKPEDHAGFLGAWTGEGYDVWEARGDGQVMKSDGISVQMDGAFAPFNEDVYKRVGTVRKDVVPRDCGNVHDTYWQAYHANVRKAAMITQGVRLIIEETTDLDVLDVVNLRLVAMDMGIEGRQDVIDESRGGPYVISAKKEIMRGNKYAELFLLHRLAVNTSGKVTLVADSNQRGQQPTPTAQPTDNAGKSTWTYETEKRYEDPKDGCRDIIDEECMPTAGDSTEWDTPEDWTDGNAARNGPYEIALTGKTGSIRKREKDTDPPAQ